MEKQEGDLDVFGEAFTLIIVPRVYRIRFEFLNESLTIG